MKAIFKGKILDYENAEFTIVGQGKILVDGMKYKEHIIYWENFHERDLKDIRTQLYVNDIVEFGSNTILKIENITKDLDGNVYYYTNHIIENRRITCRGGN